VLPISLWIGSVSADNGVKFYVTAAALDRESPERQAAIFVACIGADAYVIYSTMEFTDEVDRRDPTKLLEAFKKHCLGEMNEVYER